MEKLQNMFAVFRPHQLLWNAEDFKSGGQVVAGSCHVSLYFGGMGGHSVVVSYPI